MVMWHLRKRKPALRLVGKVQIAANARVFLEALQDAENVRNPEGPMIKRAQDLCTEVPGNVVDEVLQPVILVGVPRQRMPRPMVDGV